MKKITSQKPELKHMHELKDSLDELHETMLLLPDQYKWVFRPGRHLWFSFAKGIAYGLGLLAAVAIVVPLCVALLREINWVPIVGDFVAEVAERIERVNSRR